MTDDPVGGKCGYVWGGTALFCLVVAYFCLPEYKVCHVARAHPCPRSLLTTQGRSYRELDILFHRRVAARKFSKTEIGIEEDE